MLHFGIAATARLSGMYLQKTAGLLPVTFGCESENAR